MILCDKCGKPLEKDYKKPLDVVIQYPTYCGGEYMEETLTEKSDEQFPHHLCKECRDSLGVHVRAFFSNRRFGVVTQLPQSVVPFIAVAPGKEGKA